MKARSIVALAAALGLTAPALADAPSVIPVQGYLAGADGSVVNDVFAVTFTLYSDAAGTSSLWSEEAPVNFVDGYFTAYLGSTTSLDLTTFRDNSGVYLGVKVGDDEEMTPFEVGTAPFAGFAQYAGFAADITDAAKVQIVGDVAVQLDNDGKVHDKYTDAEAIAAVTNALANDATQLEAALGATDNSNTLNHARYTDAEAIAALASHTSDPAAHHAKYTDAEAQAAVTAAPLTGDLEISGNLVVGGGIDTDGPGGRGPAQIQVMDFGRGGSTTYSFVDITGTSHSLNVGDASAAVGNSHIYFSPGTAGVSDSYLLLNIEGSTTRCTLLHREDDGPRVGLYYATDGGNTGINQTAWGNTGTSTFMLRFEGRAGHVLNTNATYSVVCF